LTLILNNANDDDAMPTHGGSPEPLLDQPSASPEQTSNSPEYAKKRKRVSDVGGTTEKAGKTSQTKRAKVLLDEELDLNFSIKKSFSQMDNALLADYMAQRTRKFENDLSSVELEDRAISAHAIRDTTSWDQPRTLENLPGFLEKFTNNPTKLWSASKKNGAPHTIIVAGAGLRAADLARIIRKFQTKEATVAKLFAKHIKLKDAVKFLQGTRIGIAVGTPTRLLDLMDNGTSARPLDDIRH